jgi:hypothetical protein
MRRPPDNRVVEAQALFFVIDDLRLRGAESAAVPLLRRMARLHEDRARELLGQSKRDPDGWPELYAAITAAAEAGNKNWALDMIQYGRDVARNVQLGGDEIAAELERLKAWLETLHVVPSLGELDRPIPPIPAGIAA